jgi:arylsulfatase A-like enzyme
MGEPLIVRLPSGGASRRSAHIVSSLDFAPTILAWAGLVYPPTATASGQHVVLTGR